MILTDPKGELLDLHSGFLSEKGYEVLTREITPVIEKQLTLWKTENK